MVEAQTSPEQREQQVSSYIPQDGNNNWFFLAQLSL